MLYSNVGMKRTSSWYLELADAKSWQPIVMSGITAQEFESFAMQNPKRAKQSWLA
jgi:hypothetical protein